MLTSSILLLILWCALASGLTLTNDQVLGQFQKPTPIHSSFYYKEFHVENDLFHFNGQAMQIFAGCFHYFRVIEEYWETRLDSMKAMGLNTVEFYVAWNFHEPVQGEIDFSSKGKNLRKFLQLIKDREMLAIIRPGPYICAEWEFGGLPAWLLDDGSIKLRTYAQPFISHVSNWMTRLYEEVEPFTIDNGGPIVMLQIENEYGSLGNVAENENDKKYVQHLVTLAQGTLGHNLILFTTDPNNYDGMIKGSLTDDSVITMGDGCDNATETWAAQKRMNSVGQSPFLCTETYTGWISHYGEEFSRKTTQEVVEVVSQILAVNNDMGSVSLYMAFGGSNIGFWAGANANGDDPYTSDLQSYDYNAPIAESGEHGIGSDGIDKFEALRKLFTKDEAPFPDPTLPERKGFGHIHLSSYQLFWDNIDELSYTIVHNEMTTNNMESYQCYYGFIAYVGTFSHALTNAQLAISNVKDFAFVFVDDVFIGQLDRNNKNATLNILSAKAGSQLKILVQNMGRVNFDVTMESELKGISGVVYVNGYFVDLILKNGWEVYCTNFAFIKDNGFRWKSLHYFEKDYHKNSPTLFRGSFNAEKGVDTWLNIEGWHKGLMIVNGYNLGYYWVDAGPQTTVFIPGPYLKNGRNTVVMFEISQIPENLTLESIDHAKFGF